MINVPRKPGQAELHGPLNRDGDHGHLVAGLIPLASLFERIQNPLRV
jgi:hypothetical protein